MKNVNRLLIIAIVSIVVFASCKKKDNDNTCTLSEANIAGTYKLQSALYKSSSSSPEVDGTAFLDPCELDDVTTFKTDHTFTYTDAGTQCSSSGDYSGSWSLNGSTLNYDGVLSNVDAFDCSILTISDTSYYTDGDKITFKLKKQ